MKKCEKHLFYNLNVLWPNTISPINDLNTQMFQVETRDKRLWMTALGLQNVLSIKCRTGKYDHTMVYGPYNMDGYLNESVFMNSHRDES